MKGKQTFRCNTKECHNETRHAMPKASWLQVEIVSCPNCGRLIAFSTLYPPKALVRKSVKLP
jgi:hypothetical protein